MTLCSEFRNEFVSFAFLYPFDKIYLRSWTNGEPVRRERTRTPPRHREGTYWRRRPLSGDDSTHERCRRQDEHGDGRGAPGLQRESAQAGSIAVEFLPQQRLLDDAQLMNKTTGELQGIFSKQASRLKSGLQAMAESEVRRADINDVLFGAQEYIDKACRFAKRLGIADEPHGNVAWSTAEGSMSTVPVTRIFSRLKASLQAPTIADVDAALAALQLAANDDTQSAPGDGVTTVGSEDGDCNVSRGDHANTLRNLDNEPAENPPAATLQAVDRDRDGEQGVGPCDESGLPLKSAQEGPASTTLQEQAPFLAHNDAGLEEAGSE